MEILGTIWDWLRVNGPALSGLSPLVMALQKKKKTFLGEEVSLFMVLSPHD